MEGRRRARSSGAYAWAPSVAEMRDVGLHVRVAGQAPPTFLLLHGLAGSQRYFGAVFDGLAQEGRLVVPDLLGFGGSPRPEDGDYGPDAHVDAAIDALEELRVQSPLYVGAHSVGTLVALRLAVRRPDWVRAIVAFGPPLYRTPEEARVHLSRLGLFVRLFAMETRWARAVCAWMCGHREAAARIAEWMRPDLPPEVARDGVQHNWFSYSGSFRNLVLGAQGAPDLSRVEVRVHLIAGDRDPVVEPEFLRELARVHRHVQLEWWPGGHDLPLQDPERCVAALRSLASGGQNQPRSPTATRS